MSKLQQIQQILGVTPDGIWGTKSQAAFDALLGAPGEEVNNPAPDEDTQPDIISDDSKRHINDRGLELVKHFEALYLEAYKDEVGVWTIGWGHTGLVHQDGTVFRGRTITKEEAIDLLKYDMNVFERRVDAFISEPLTEDQYSALVSFDFNTGGLENSTLRRVLNAGDKDEAAKQFMRWDKAGGRRLKGLTRRRISEKRLFQGKADFICRLDDPELEAIYS
jgi:lysozyme